MNVRSFQALLRDRISPQPHPTTAVVRLVSLAIVLSLLGMARQALALMQEGDRTSEVTALQQRLQELGYFQGNATGYFGSVTKEAVIRFQQAKGLTPDGIVGSNTSTSLGEQAKSNVQPLKETSTPLWKLGDRGVQVSAIQESLAAAGFSSGKNGIFDQATQNAVQRFQQAKQLTVDGVVGPQTLAALPVIGGSKPTPAPRTTRNQFDIQALQKRLQERGFYNGSIDGIWGPQTQAGVEAAQRAYSVSTADIQNGNF